MIHAFYHHRWVYCWYRCVFPSVFVCEKSPLRNLPTLHYWNNTLRFLLSLEKPIAWTYLPNWCRVHRLLRTGSPQRHLLMSPHMPPPPPESPKWRANGIDGNLFFLKCQTARKCFLEPFGTGWAYYWDKDSWNMDNNHWQNINILLKLYNKNCFVLGFF